MIRRAPVPRHPDPLMLAALAAEQSVTYAAFVPCYRSSRRVAVPPIAGSAIDRLAGRHLATQKCGKALEADHIATRAERCRCRNGRRVQRRPCSQWSIPAVQRCGSKGCVKSRERPLAAEGLGTAAGARGAPCVGVPTLVVTAERRYPQR